MSASVFHRDPAAGAPGTQQAQPDAAATGAAPGRRRRAASAPISWTLAGLCGTARVATSFGELPVQALRRNDPLRLPGGRLATVEWVDRISLDEGFLDACPDALPVLIPAHAFGPGRPKNPIMVSPHQIVDTGSSPYQRAFRRARSLLDRPGFLRKPEFLVSYHLFHCGAPEAVQVEGLTLLMEP